MNVGSLTSPTRRLLVAVAALVLVAAIAVVAMIGPGSGSSPSIGGVASDRPATVPVGSGVSLAAEIITPRGRGAHPLVVMPASWGQPATEYRAVGRALASSGYQVVAYAQRGFATSTGAVDFAGPATQRDASTVITWALAHTPADRSHIGLLGISYGAGISLLAAAHDRRIRAVAALSTWSDLAASFDPQSTPSVLGLRLLLGAAPGTLRLAPEVEHLRQTLADDPAAVGDVIRAMSPARSPLTYVAQLNANRPAILLANAYEDSLFGPGQLVTLFNRLTGPKRLQLAPGDHAGPELGALFGRPDTTMDDARAWLDHYLRGRAGRAHGASPIELRDVVTGAVHRFSTWPTSPATLRPVDLPATLAAGSDSVATSGPTQFFTFRPYVPPQITTRELTPDRAALWTGPTTARPSVVAGSVRVRMRIESPSAGAASVYAYLYDVDERGTGRLMTWQPVTATGLTPGRPRDLDLALPPVAWTVARGHHLLLVVDRADPRFQSAVPAPAEVVVESAG
ncbi:MAG TPA: alpha/beta fold hydrolase [Jatrophihabitans sp.]|jgi:predicted acyl esterase|uniref:alpha/beta fold hydrolase n=1 Tax=Jatrophihabitans sp. TaxID=1932789 RepID=UPI002DFA81A1|nr:alpha/beta fold hydrolase [Jatrophihabitans sp.]